MTLIVQQLQDATSISDTAGVVEKAGAQDRAAEAAGTTSGSFLNSASGLQKEKKVIAFTELKLPSGSSPGVTKTLDSKQCDSTGSD